MFDIFPSEFQGIGNWSWVTHRESTPKAVDNLKDNITLYYTLIVVLSFKVDQCKMWNADCRLQSITTGYSIVAEISWSFPPKVS